MEVDVQGCEFVLYLAWYVLGRCHQYPLDQWINHPQDVFVDGECELQVYHGTNLAELCDCHERGLIEYRFRVADKLAVEASEDSHTEP